MIILKNLIYLVVPNVTQLPMLRVRTHLRGAPDSDGKYLPYIHGEISHIYNTFGHHNCKKKIWGPLEIKWKIKVYL